MSCLREAAPLLDLDRDERKLDAFLQLHKTDLQVSDLRIFLPFTINLDPYLRKVLKGKTKHGRQDLLIKFLYISTEDQQAIDDEGIIIPMKPSMPHVPFNNPYHRSQGNFFQSQQAAAYARAAMPMYSTTVTNAPIAMMNYFNTAANQQAMNIEQDPFINQSQQLQLQPPKKQLSIDLVSSLNC